MKKSIILLFILFAAATQIQAQQLKGNSLLGLSWEIAFPSGNDYLDKTSLAGGRIEYRYMVRENMSAGLAMSWNSFNQYVGTHTYTTGDGATSVTTDMIRQIYTLPLTAIFHYYPNTSKSAKIRPSLGLGLGAQYAEQNSYFNVYELASNNWGFVMRPEIGAFVSLGSGIGFLVTGSYQMSTNKNEDLRIDNISQFG